MSNLNNNIGNTDDFSAKSITHEHFLGVILSEVSSKYFENNTTIKILDVGCGNGELIKYLSKALTACNLKCNFEIYGLDVIDYGVQSSGFELEMLRKLKEFDNTINWTNRVKFITYEDDWPFQSKYFDFVISNQVLEHVQNHTHFFAQQNRVLNDPGIALHLFPLKEIWYEGHLYLFFVHWFKNWNGLAKWIEVCSRLGLGKFKKSGMSLESYVVGHADYINLYTNYLTEKEILNVSKKAGLRTSFTYTADFYIRKLKKIFGQRVILLANKYVFMDFWFIFILKRVSSISLYQLKANEYERFE